MVAPDRKPTVYSTRNAVGPGSAGHCRSDRGDQPSLGLVGTWVKHDVAHGVQAYSMPHSAPVTLICGEYDMAPGGLVDLDRVCPFDVETINRTDEGRAREVNGRIAVRPEPDKAKTQRFTNRAAVHSSRAAAVGGESVSPGSPDAKPDSPSRDGYGSGDATTTIRPFTRLPTFVSTWPSRRISRQLRSSD